MRAVARGCPGPWQTAAWFLDCGSMQARATGSVRRGIDPVRSTGVLAFVAYLAIALSDGAQTVQASAALTVGIAAIVAVGALLTPRVWLPGGPALAALGALGALCLLTTASALWASDDGLVEVEAVRAVGYLGLLTITVVGIRAGEGRALLTGLAAAIVVVVGIALVARLLPGLLEGDRAFLEQFPEAVRGRLSYPIGYWNGLGMVAALGVVVLAWLGGHGAGPRVRAGAVAALPAALLTIYLTGSRGAVLAAIAGCALLIAMTPVRARALAGLAIGGVGALVLVVAVFTDQDLVEGVGESAAVGQALLLAAVVAACFAVRLRLEAALRLPELPRILDGRLVAVFTLAALVATVAIAWSVSRATSFGEVEVGDKGRGELTSRFLATGGNGRQQLWETALDGFASEPVHGLGAGGFGTYWNQNGSLAQPVRDAHSIYFEALAELGPLGLAAVLALLGSGAWAARARTFGDRSGLVAVAAAMLAAGAVGAGVDWLWEIPAGFGLVVVAIGLLCGRATARAPGDERRLGARGSIAARVAAGALALGAILLAGPVYLSERELDRSRDLAGAGDLAGAAEAARGAADLRPLASEPWLQLGLVQGEAGDFLGAQASFEEAVARSPEDPVLVSVLGLTYRVTGDPRAEPLIEFSEELFPADR